MGKSKRKIVAYVVFEGATPGVYSSWSDAEPQVKGYPGSKFCSYSLKAGGHERAQHEFKTYLANAAGSSQHSRANSNPIQADSASGTPDRAGSQAPLSFRTGEAVFPQANTKCTKRSRGLSETSNRSNKKRQRFNDKLRPYEYYEPLSASKCKARGYTRRKNKKRQHKGQASKASFMDSEEEPTQHKENSLQVFDVDKDYSPGGDFDGDSHTEDEFEDKELDSELSDLLSNLNPVSEPPLCKEQVDLVETIISGRNVFYTGSAGCGKSTVLNRFVRFLRDQDKCVSIVAPTGRAALNVNGSTFYSYAGWTPNTMRRDMDDVLAGCHRKRIWKRLNQTDVLVIDEISMVENFCLERLNRVMKEARKNRKNGLAAFGGVQVIVAGDFLQLPPVQPLQFCLECGKQLEFVSNRKRRCAEHAEYNMADQWAFMSDAWRECDFVHVNLTTVHRQKDASFINLLEKLRMGKPLDDEDRDMLLNHDSQIEGAIKLFSRREDVKKLNDREFALLQTPIITYTCFDHFQMNPDHIELAAKAERDPVDGSLIALDEHRLEKMIEVKVGMLVMLLCNLSFDDGLVNGSQGRVIGFKPAPKPKELFEFNGEHASHKSALIGRYVSHNKCNKWPVVRFHNNVERTIYPVCMVNELGESPWSLISRTQVPLVAAWAMTIHKSQGMTIPKVSVDLADTFEKGHDYVALSRATRLEGLKVENLGKLSRGIDPQVQAFLHEKFGL